MKSWFKFGAAMCMGIVSSLSAYGDETAHCNAVLEHGARNFVSTLDFSSQKAYAYSKACNDQYFNATGNTKLGIEAVIKKIPIGIDFGSSNTKEQVKKWCSENKNLEDRLSISTFDENTVFRPAIDAWLNCKNAYASGLKVSTEISADSRSIAFQVTNDTTDNNVVLRGVDISDDTILCKASTDEETVLANLQTRVTLPPKQSINVNCNRQAKDVTRDGQKISIYPGGSITINTKLKNYQISMPEISVVRLTDVYADKVEQQMSKIALELKSMKSNPVRAMQGFTNHRGGGSNAVSMQSSCPANQVMVGIEMIIGGTCQNQCNADGGAFHKYRIICAPRFN